MLNSIDRIGKLPFDLYRTLKAMVIFLYLSFRTTLTLEWRSLSPILSILISQIYFTGFQALPLITFIALATGSVVVLQSAAQLTLLGSKEMMGNILVVTIIRELGPLLTALIVIARSGTAVATELGSMQVNKEIESLRSVSIDPYGYVVFPRLLGGVISLVSLAFYFNCIALIGGFIVGHFVSDLSLTFYLDVLAQSLTMEDIALNIIKNSLSGLIIFTIATYYGMGVKGAPHEVPMATTRAVVHSIMCVVAFNVSITIYMFARALA